MKTVRNLILPLVVSSLLIGCASTRHQESAGQYLDNSVITAKVKSKLAADSEVNSLGITVNSYKNTVQLSGFVDNKKQSLHAAELAGEVPGVYSVKNNLVIK